MIKTKRIYEKPSRSDGRRILVDRIWPRGLTKDEVRVDEWMKDLAPSSALRKWFGHDPKRWNEFREKYFRELDEHPELVAKLREQAAGRDVTLLYAAKDRKHNNAVCLAEYLTRRKA